MKQRIMKILESKNAIYKEMKDGDIILLSGSHLVSIEFVNDEYVKVYDETGDYIAYLLDSTTIIFDLGYVLGIFGMTL